MAEQISATVLKLGTQALLQTSQDWSFPTKEIAMEEVVNGDINASISWQGTTYYVSETLASLITAANAGAGGSSYLTFESYQNSAMLDPVDCYVWRDADEVIWKVYEPTRNNTVSRSQFDYVDSMDLFAFDNVNNYDNNLSDVKFITVPTATVFQVCILETMIINATSKTGIQFIGHKHWGNFGNNIVSSGGHGEEIYITGNDVIFNGNTALAGRSDANATFFDDLAEGSVIKGSEFGNSCYIFGNGFKTKITDCDLGQFTWFTLDADMSGFEMLDVVTEEAAYIEMNAAATFGSCKMEVLSSIIIDTVVNIIKCKIGVNAYLEISHTTQECEFGVSTEYTSAGNKSKANFINIAGVTYEIGENTGAATLTPV